MTKQKAFDDAYVGILRQGGPGYDPITRSCVYENSIGHRCAIGHLLPDGPWLKHRGGISGLLGADSKYNEARAYVSDNYPGVDLRFLHELQRAHDAAVLDCKSFGENFGEDFTKHYRSRMLDLSLRLGLSPAVID